MVTYIYKLNLRQTGRFISGDLAILVGVEIRYFFELESRQSMLSTCNV